MEKRVQTERMDKKELMGIMATIIATVITPSRTTTSILRRTATHLATHRPVTKNTMDTKLTMDIKRPIVGTGNMMCTHLDTGTKIPRFTELIRLWLGT